MVAGEPGRRRRLRALFAAAAIAGAVAGAVAGPLVNAGEARKQTGSIWWADEPTTTTQPDTAANARGVTW